MLKENIKYGIEKLILGSTDDIKDVVKNYMLLGIKYNRENFDYIEYRNHSIIIDDVEGVKDAFELENEIKNQVKEINDIKDSKEV
jgi:hypothetical protein